MSYKKDPRYNDSGYLDMTAYKALKRAEQEERRVRKLLSVIRAICELVGYRVDQLAIRDKKGKVWR